MITLQEAMCRRHAVRAYTDRPIEADKAADLQALTDRCNRASGLHIQFIQGDPKAFDSRLARYGKFAGVANYFAMIGPKGPDLDERLGYWGEHLVLRAQQLGLNTCWVGMTFKKNPAVLTIGRHERLRCVIAVGYGQTQGTAHRVKSFDRVARLGSSYSPAATEGTEPTTAIELATVMKPTTEVTQPTAVTEPTTNIEPATEVTKPTAATESTTAMEPTAPDRQESAFPAWFRRGVEAALLAPTAVNQQKFRFTLVGDHRVQARAALAFFSKVDLGIAKYHFELGAAEPVVWE